MGADDCTCTMDGMDVRPPRLPGSVYPFSTRASNSDRGLLRAACRGVGNPSVLFAIVFRRRVTPARFSNKKRRERVVMQHERRDQLYDFTIACPAQVRKPKVLAQDRFDAWRLHMPHGWVRLDQLSFTKMVQCKKILDIQLKIAIIWKKWQ